MSPRKKQPVSGTKRQAPINSYFSIKTKPSAVPGPSNRLIQSHIVTRPLRSRKSPERDEVLDLTRSTSPSAEEHESPPSAKKRKIGAKSSDRSPQQSARHDLFDDDLSPLTPGSPVSRLDHSMTPVGFDRAAKNVAVSPSPSPIGNPDLMMIDDPSDIVESSQTQYINLYFTPPSCRTRVMETSRVPAPVFTPTSHRRQTPNREAASVEREVLDASGTPTQGSLGWRIPSSQGEVSEPRTPRKRSWALVENARTPSRPSILGGARNSGSEVVPSSVASSSQESQMPPPVLPASAMRGLMNQDLGRGTERDAGPSTRPAPPAERLGRAQNGLTGPASSSRLASLRSRQVHPSSDDRPDHIPSSQGEPSLAPTELGTLESPQKLLPYPTIDTDLLTTIPSSVPSSQEAPNNANISFKQHPLTHSSHFAQPMQSRTPSRAIDRDLTSSPTNLPSPHALFSSMGMGSAVPTQESIAPPRLVSSKAVTPIAIEKRALDPKLGLPLSAPNSETPGSHPQEDRAHAHAAQSQSSPDRNRSSSQTIIPSSQPVHDSSPPPEYDIGPEMHSLTQAQLQLQPQQNAPPDASTVQTSPGSIRKSKSQGRHVAQSSPRFYPSETESSQFLPSESPIKGSRINPDISAAGMDGVFGMLGFGSEAENHGSSFRANQADVVHGTNSTVPHAPLGYDLPPSSPPPPETPPHNPARVSQAKLNLGTPTANHKYLGSPLLAAFKHARDRAKAATPAKTRLGPPASRAIPSSPVAALNSDLEILGESVIEDSQPRSQRGLASTTRGKVQARSQSTGIRSGSGSTRPKRATRTPCPVTPKQRTPLSTRSKNMDVDFVGSSDAEEEAMEMEARSPLLDITMSPARSTINMPIIPNPCMSSKTRASVQIHEKDAHRPGTPIREGRLPSSGSPSPIRTRYSSPPPLPEDTQTQDESETVWESLRPSQSVSQVLERRIIEEALAEAERGRVLRAEQEAHREKERAEERRREDEERAIREASVSQLEGKGEEEPANRGKNTQEATPAIVRPHSSTALPPTVLTPRSRRVLGKDIYIVTPTKVVKRTPIKIQQDRVVTMTPSSPAGENEEESQEYTYVDETFNPTESQMSFLNRIVNASSELE